MIMYAKIRRMYFRDKLSISEIARRNCQKDKPVLEYSQEMADGTSRQGDQVPSISL